MTYASTLFSHGFGRMNDWHLIYHASVKSACAAYIDAHNDHRLDISAIAGTFGEILAEAGIFSPKIRSLIYDLDLWFEPPYLELRLFRLTFFKQ